MNLKCSGIQLLLESPGNTKNADSSGIKRKRFPGLRVAAATTGLEVGVKLAKTADEQLSVLFNSLFDDRQQILDILLGGDLPFSCPVLEPLHDVTLSERFRYILQPFM